MEMATKNDNRMERRRRIMSREMDRMAVITGRIRNLPPSPPPSPSSPSPFLYHQTHQRGHSHTGISPSFFSKELHKNPDSIPLPQIPGASKPKDLKPAPLLKHMSINEEKMAAIGYQFDHQKLDPIGEVHTEIVSTPSAISMIQKPTIDNELLSKTQPSKPKLFTSKRLNAYILASQTTRVFCSVIIASLAVLSQIDHPLFIIRNMVRSESVVASKPIYILLLTDATIVMARMLAEKQKDSGEAVEECEKMKEDGHNWDSAVKVLERGHIDHSARVMRVITWNQSFKGLSNMHNGKDDFYAEDQETHATVLDKLLAWEKKLYDEVKAGEIMKFEYQRKVAALNRLKKRGSNS